MHEELAEIGVPGETMKRFTKLHDRYTAAYAFILKQRELAKSGN